jgi:lipid II:glycine glycyltransferase (peptidoglycan interpeptide bridge formation enzyme)
VLPWKDKSRARQAAIALHREIRSLADRAGAPLIRIEPSICGEIPYWPGSLICAPIDLIPTPTLLVDLTGSEEEILASMKPKGRYNIRLASRRGVEVFRSERPEPVDEFYLLFEVTMRRHDFAGEPKSFFTNMIRTLGPMVRVYFASYRGMILSAAVVVMFAEKATFLYGGSLPFCRSVMAPYGMHWQIMRDARELGCWHYDFYGIAPEGEPMHRYVRFSQFKSRFGGKVVRTAGARDEYLYPQLANLWIRKLAETTHIN